MPDAKPRPRGRRATRLRQGRYNARRPALALRVDADEAERIKAAGGLQEIVRSFLAGDTVPRSAAEDAAEAAAAEVEELALKMIAEREAQLQAADLRAKEAQAALEAARARADAAELRIRGAQAQDREVSWGAGYAAGLADGKLAEANRRARAEGRADAAEAASARAQELVRIAREAGWRINWQVFVRQALRHDCLREVGRLVPRQYRRQWDSGFLGLADHR